MTEEARRLVEIQNESYALAGSAIRSAWPPQDAMDAAELADFLVRNDYAVLATVTPDGRPQASPIAYFVRDGAFWIATVAGARLRNLRANPNAALVIAEGGRGTHSAVRAEGTVVLHEGPDTAALRAAWQLRHGGDAGWAAAFAELRPQRIFSHANR